MREKNGVVINAIPFTIILLIVYTIPTFTKDGLLLVDKIYGLQTTPSLFSPRKSKLLSIREQFLMHLNNIPVL